MQNNSPTQCPHQWRFSARRLPFLVLCIFFAWNSLVSINTASAQTESKRQITVGISGHFRLGCWTEIRVEALSSDPIGAGLTVRAVDGNGNDASFVYSQPKIFQQDGKSYYVGYFKAGREFPDLRVSLVGSDKQSFFQQSVGQSEEATSLQIHPATFSLWVQLGSERNISNAVPQIQNEPDNQIVVIQVKDLRELPLETAGWNSFRRVVCFASQDSGLPNLNPLQIESLKKWVDEGGRISFSGTKYLKELIALENGFSWLLSSPSGSQVTPPALHYTKDVSSLEIFASSRTQVFTGSRQRLEYLAFDSFKSQDEFVLEEHPVLVRKLYGFGRIDLIGLDFESSPLKEWKSTSSAIREWLAEPVAGKVALNSAFGYSDVTGQMRTALEKFPSVSLISFTLVMAVILFFLICCGLDYFLLRNVLRNVQLTWLTLPFYVAAFTGLSVWIFYSQKSQEVRVNQIEILDIDAATGKAKSRFWTHVYSPKAENFRFEVPAVGPSKIPVSESSLCWEGLPGTGLGAMRSKNLVSVSKTQYDVFPSMGVSDQKEQAAVEGMKIPLASTVSLAGEWTGKIDPKNAVSHLSYSSNLDRMTGRFVNPLDVRLEDCYLIFGNWAYRLDAPVAPGGEIDIQADTTPIAISRWLTRRRELEDSTRVTPWDPTSGDMQRILELMMFNQLGGGRDYIRMTHRYRPEVDFSHLTQMGKAVFLGRTDKLTTSLITNGTPADGQVMERQATAVRIVLPVRLIDEK